MFFMIYELYEKSHEWPHFMINGTFKGSFSKFSNAES